MKKTPVVMDIQTIPSRLRWAFDGANVFDSSCGEDAQVLYLDTGYYLKIQKKGTLAGEANRGKIFAGLGLGVEVLDYISDDRDYLLTRAAEGEDMTHFLSDPKLLCRILAESLRRLHDSPAAGIGLSPTYARYQRAAETGEGNYEEFVLMERFPVSSRAEAWAIMGENRHRLKADTLIHGDACLPNVVVKDGAFSSFIDFSHAGLGDRHIDLYWALWSLQFNLGTEEYTDYFLDCYGRERVDLSLLRTVAAFEVFG